jgi:hypothetical protein
VHSRIVGRVMLYLPTLGSLVRSQGTAEGHRGVHYHVCYVST